MIPHVSWVAEQKGATIPPPSWAAEQKNVMIPPDRSLQTAVVRSSVWLIFVSFAGDLGAATFVAHMIF